VEPRPPILIPERVPKARPVVGAARAVMLGAPAAWRTPAVIDRSLAELLAPAPRTSVHAHPHDAHRAVHLSHRVLGKLARIRPTRWRATCLYRSVAECLVLRALGHPARVVIGVGTGTGTVGVMAHAWVECEGIDCLSTRGAAELERLSTRPA
jgi:hypothetical protein